MADEQERRRGADDGGLPDDDVFGFAPKVKAKAWRPSTMAPFPLPSPTTTEKAEAKAPQPARPPELPWDTYRHVRGVDRAGVTCSACRATNGRPCTRKDGSVASGFHPQRVTLAEREAKTVGHRGALTPVERAAPVDLNEALPAVPASRRAPPAMRPKPKAPDAPPKQAPGNGRFLPGFEPFGFDGNGAELPEEQAMIEAARAMANDGATLQVVLDAFLAVGFKRRDGRALTRSALSKAMGRI